MYKLRDKKTGLYLTKRHGWNELSKKGKLYYNRPSLKNTIWGREVEWEIVEFELVEKVKTECPTPLQNT